jgi:hypothetical protein
MYTLPQQQCWMNAFVFYNINTVFKCSTKKKDLNPKMKMGTNSFGVHIYVSTRIRKMPVWEIFRKLALIPGNVRTYPKVCVGKRLEYR